MTIKKKYLLSTAAFVLACIASVVYYKSFDSGPIVSFVEERDTKEILDIFYNDWYWLFPGPDYSPEFILKNKAPGKEWYQARYMGKLHIKVLRESGKVAGFTTFYKKNFYEGHIQFVAVAKDFRKKGYGQMLTEHAIKSLIDLGSKKITLLTRLNNTRARSIYERIGFKETRRDDGFIFYFITPKVFKEKNN
ncbi:GNAT family N-acetyltransferase [bacterium]|nr:GNAT family N-acetyltransferase [bacterium]